MERESNFCAMGKKVIVAIVLLFSFGFFLPHATAGQSAELFLQLGHSFDVTSVAFSPDGRTLASGNWNNTVKLWEVVSGEIKMSIALLPGNEWIAYHPQKLVYNSSLQGDEYAAVRFDNQLHPIYPLVYYRKELKRFDLDKALLLHQPVIRPKPIRLWWDEAENKELWFGGIFFVALTGLVVTLILRKRSDPMEIAGQFFAQANFQKVEPLSGDLLLLRPKEGLLTGLVTLWQEGPFDGSGRISALLQHKKRLEV